MSLLTLDSVIFFSLTWFSKTCKFVFNSDSRFLGTSKNEAVYDMLSDPVTPNEVARKLGVTQKTAQRVLMHLALTRKDVKYKNSGRTHIFWKEKEVKNIDE